MSKPALIYGGSYVYPVLRVRCSMPQGVSPRLGSCRRPWRLYYTRYYTGAAISTSQSTDALVGPVAKVHASSLPADSVLSIRSMRLLAAFRPAPG
jgi:hypothetical protein